MQHSQQDLATKANQLFTYFETHKFQNKLSYCHNTNLVLEFCDYVENMADWEILDWLQSEDEADAQNFRQMINNGVDTWLGDLIKTISLRGA